MQGKRISENLYFSNFSRGGPDPPPTLVPSALTAVLGYSESLYLTLELSPVLVLWLAT
jgi:hypothetical protein